MQPIEKNRDYFLSRDGFTEGLGLHVNLNKRCAGKLNYFDLFDQWWNHFNIGGYVLLIGHAGRVGDEAKQYIKRTYPDVTEVWANDLEGPADVVWDICNPRGPNVSGFNCVNCQAVLEHVVDPVQAMRNMTEILNPGGRLFIHSHGRNFGYHRWPLDTYRFNRDALIVWADLTNTKLVDLWCNEDHVFGAYEK